MRLFLTRNFCDTSDASAYAAAVGFCANRADFDPIVFVGGVAADELWRSVDAIDDEVEIAVVVEIAEGTAARGGGSRNSGAGVKRDVFEVAVAQIAIEKLALRIAGFGGELFDFGIDVAVADEDVGPTVVVKIEEAAAPAEILRMLAETGLERGVFKS